MSKLNIHMDDGYKLVVHHYSAEDSSPDQGAVLYIHGATFSADLSVGFKFDGFSWADDLGEAGFDVWALDFIGFGASDRLPNCPEGIIPGKCPEAVQQIEAAVREILAQSGNKHISIIAHSRGTLPAGAFAAAHPDLIERLVMFGPIAQRQGALAPLSPLSPASMSAFQQITIQSQYDRFVCDVPAAETPVLSAAHFTDWAAAYLATDNHSADFNPPAVTVPSGPAADIQDAWAGRFPYDPSQITCPVLIVRGEWDSLIPDADAAWLFNSLSRAAAKQDIKLAKATHLAHLERGRFDLYQATRDFLLRDRINTATTTGPVAVIFEVELAAGRKADYLDIAARIRPLLDQSEGFVSVERFQSLTNPKKILSLSFFKDDAAVRRWRTLDAHRNAQGKGRGGIFADYHLRIAHIIRDYGMLDRHQAPADSKMVHRSIPPGNAGSRP